MPVGGSWKTLIRLQDGRDLSAAAIFLPEDSVLEEAAVPAERAQRSLGDEKVILQRELKDDVPTWLWTVAGLIVLLCSAILVTSLGWGIGRFNRRGPVEREPGQRSALR